MVTRNIKSALTNQIFKQEMLHTYEQKSQSRDELVRGARRMIRQLTQEMAQSLCAAPEIEQKMEQLASDKNLKLEDLSLEDTEWAPVASFSGAFKGNGHTISDVSLVGAYSPAGFFGILEEGGSIQDLTIKGVVNPAGTQKTAGGLVGTNYGTIINCTFSGAVHGEEEAGGLVGRNETSGTIDHSTSRAMVSGAYATGGIVGYNLGVITGCTNVGAVNSEYQESALDMEGLPATLLELVKKDMGDDLSNNISNVSSDTGGIAGRSSGLILSSANAGDVGYAHVGYNVGGIVGRTDGLISGCVNQGLVQGRKDVGGIAGQAEPYVELDLDQTVTRTLNGSAYPAPGLFSKFFDRQMQPMLEVVQDTVGRHDAFALACAARYYESHGYFGHDNCSDNLSRVLASHGVKARNGWPAINFFFNTGIDAHQQMTLDEPWSRPGDYVLLRAMTDLVCGSTSCPDDIDPANGWNPTDIHVRLYSEKERFSIAMSTRATADADPILTRESAFHGRTRALTSSFVDYRNWWLPLRYDGYGAIEEYLGCRERVAVMDLTALRKFEIIGPDAEALLQYCLTRDVRKLAVGQVVYTATADDSS